MKHEKSPQHRPGCLRGCESSNKTIINFSTKNNAPGNQENLDRHYMALAVQYGHIELQKGLSLYSAAGIEALGLKTKEGIKAAFPSGAFFFVTEKYIFECSDPSHILDCMAVKGKKPCWE